MADNLDNSVLSALSLLFELSCIYMDDNLYNLNNFALSVLFMLSCIII